MCKLVSKTPTLSLSHCLSLSLSHTHTHAYTNTRTYSVLLSIPGVEVDPRDDDGWTPLHAALYWGSMDAAELLILSGANIFLKTNNVSGIL